MNAKATKLSRGHVLGAALDAAIKRRFADCRCNGDHTISRPVSAFPSVATHYPRTVGAAKAG